jgi:hypothetical protein
MGEGFNEDLQEIDETTSALSGENAAGFNLSGTNLAGTNLAGTNLAGANLGGNNLAGNNLAGTNLSGTNLGGNNLAGANLSGSNLAGTNLAGVNLAGANLSGSNLSGSNLSGSNLSGSNLAGNNLSGSNLSGSNLSGSNTGRNIHNLASSNGMLWSAEDVWLPKTGQCVVMGIGSTAFSKLLGQQSANAPISVALGKLPWGFANSANGAKVLSAWEAVVWGDKTYCVFVLATPNDANWLGVAGFIKAVFRWNAPPTQTMSISGIEASAPHDPTLKTVTYSYTGMMNAAAKLRAGTITARNYLAGELAFITATTNNQVVQVDFSSWVLDAQNRGHVLANVEAINKPTHAESVYSALENTDGTVQVAIYAGIRDVYTLNHAGVLNSYAEIKNAHGNGISVTPRRCGGALYLQALAGVPVSAGKCDSGLVWGPGSGDTSARDDFAWKYAAGTTYPFKDYMLMDHPTDTKKIFKRGLGGQTAMKTVLSETYVHLWEKGFD